MATAREIVRNFANSGLPGIVVEGKTSYSLRQAVKDTEVGSHIKPVSKSGQIFLVNVNVARERMADSPPVSQMPVS